MVRPALAVLLVLLPADALRADDFDESRSAWAVMPPFGENLQPGVQRDGTLRVFDTHLAGEDVDRRIAQARRVADRVRADTAPTCVVCGDFNTTDGTETEVLREFTAVGLVDHGGEHTNPSNQPYQRIDYVLLPTAARWLQTLTPELASRLQLERAQKGAVVTGVGEGTPAAEAGLPGFTAYTWVASMVPARTPRPEAERLAALMTRIEQLPETREFYERLGAEVMKGGPEELRAFQATEIAQWKRIAAKAKVELQ